MKAINRTISALFFVFLAFLPALSILSFNLKKDFIKARMEEKLEYEELETIKLNADDVVWMDKHEIWVNEKMFDIHSISVEDNIYTFTGLYDEEETLLKSEQEQAAKKSKEKFSVLSQLFQWLHTVYSETHQDYNLVATYIHSFAIMKIVYFDSLIKKVPTPPPRLPVSNT